MLTFLNPFTSHLQIQRHDHFNPQPAFETQIERIQGECSTRYTGKPLATHTLALLSETVQRLGSRLGSTFVDGGVHQRFGTRNFTMPLQNGQYPEVVCQLDHPATEQTPWGKAASKKAQEGGGYVSWVV